MYVISLAISTDLVYKPKLSTSTVYNGKVAMLATSNAQLCQFFAISRMIAKLTFNKLDDVLMSIGTEFLHDLDFSLQAFLDTLVLQIALLEDFERNL